VSSRSSKAPAWWKNTFFLFGFLLIVVAVLGFVRGDDFIRDPGQIRENNLGLIYLGAGALMVLNGWLTHRQALREYEGTQDETQAEAK